MQLRSLGVSIAVDNELVDAGKLAFFSEPDFETPISAPSGGVAILPAAAAH